MPEAIIVAVITAVSVLLGVSITQLFEYLKRKSEVRRWYSEFYLGRKVDSLHRLFSSLVNCHYTLNDYGNVSPTSLHEFQDRVQPKVDEYQISLAIATLYLSDEEKKIMSKALGVFREASRVIWLKLPNGECPADKDSLDSSGKYFPRESFIDSYNEAESCLRNMLNPEILEKTIKGL